MKRLLTIFFGLLAATTAMQAANVINNDTFWKTTMVTGNYCLNIQDKVDYTRKVSQTVKSTPVVELKDGLYTLTCTSRPVLLSTSSTCHGGGSSEQFLCH